MNDREHFGGYAGDLPRQPYHDLHIYYLEGKAGPASGEFDGRFIGNWEEDGFSFLFFTAPADGQVAAFVSSRPDLTLIDRYQMTYEQWQGGRFSAMEIGRFLIVPPWGDPGRAGEDLRKIILDPGVVFGNGLHPTTRDCVEALELLYSRHTIHRALDLGCGTGILALVAAMMGSCCLAVDFNLLAARTTLENVRLNAMEDKIVAIQGKAEDFVGAPAELIIANIHHDVMKELLNSDGFFRKKWIVLSGLLRSQARDVATLLARRGVDILKKWERDGVWHTFLGETSE